MFLASAILWLSVISGFYFLLTLISYLIESYQSKNYSPSPEHKRILMFCLILSIILWVIGTRLLSYR